MGHRFTSPLLLLSLVLFLGSCASGDIDRPEFAGSGDDRPASGSQAYRETLFFRDCDAFDRFKSERLGMAAHFPLSPPEQALRRTSATSRQGVGVSTLARGRQHFSYEPLK